METLPEQMYADLKDLLPKVADRLGVATDQLLEVGMRYVWFDLAYNVFLLLLLFVVTYGLYRLWRYVFKNWDNICRRDLEFVCLPIGIVSLAMSIGILIAAIELPKAILTAIIVPEVRMFEILSNLIK